MPCRGTRPRVSNVTRVGGSAHTQQQQQQQQSSARAPPHRDAWDRDSRATHAAVGGIDTLVKKVAKSADASKVAEAKGTLSAQEEALKAQLAALADSDSDED